MKILFTNFHHRNGGGHVTYLVNLLKTLSPDHSVSVATPGTSRLFAQAKAMPNVGTFDMRFTSRIGPMIAEVSRLRQLLQQEKFDIVHVNASADHRHVMLAALLMRHPPKIVWTKHNDHKVSSIGHRLRARFGTDAVIAVSDYVQAMLETSPYAKRPRFVIRHGVDTDYFRPVSSDRKKALRRQLLGDEADNLLVFGSSGGTDYEKGWLDLVRAAASLTADERQRIRIVVAGDPPKEAHLAVVRDLGMEAYLCFPGLVENVRDILGACDVGFVLSYREALSFACRETLALGLPTIVSDAGGLPENVDEGQDGWVVPVAHVDSIATCLRSILGQPDALHAMGLSARAKSEEQFALDLFRQRTLAVYEHVLARVEPS